MLISKSILVDTSLILEKGMDYWNLLRKSSSLRAGMHWANWSFAYLIITLLAELPIRYFANVSETNRVLFFYLCAFCCNRNDASSSRTFNDR